MNANPVLFLRQDVTLARLLTQEHLWCGQLWDPCWAVPQTILCRAVLVLIKHHLSNSCLDDELCTLVAREHCHVDGGSSQCWRIFGVEDGVCLGMDDIWIFCLQLASIRCCFGPGEIAIMTASWKAIVANAQYNLIPTNNACPNLHRGHVQHEGCILMF